jgi:DGQHR domain-containing protein
MKQAPAPLDMSGYQRTRDFAALRMKRSGKYVFTFSLPLAQVPDLLPEPKADEPFADNRVINEVKAKKFGEYWLNNPVAWAVPPLLIDCQTDLNFNSDFIISNSKVELGRLELPNDAKHLLQILDGQHRIKGWYLIQSYLIKERVKALEILNQQKRTGNQVEIDEAEKQLSQIKNNLDRLADESVTIELIAGLSRREHRDFFVTINSNQSGVNKSETIRLDSVGISAIISKELAAGHPLLLDRIEERLPSAKGSSPYFISLANLNEIIRHVMYSIKGRNTDSKLTDQDRATELATIFFDVLENNVPEFQKMINGELTPKELRKKSLWNSPTILRGLAGAFFNLVVANNKGESNWNKMVEIKQDFKPSESGLKLFIDLVKNLDNSVMALELNKENKLVIKNGNWFKTGVVESYPSAAPSSKKQGLKGLSDLFSKWAVSGEIFNPDKN